MSEDAIKSIDPNALYSVEQAARLLMKVDPGFTYEEALREVRMAIWMGDLSDAGDLSS